MKDVLHAHVMYANQEYKRYYLACIEMVTTLKQQSLRGDSEAWRFKMGYAYFMKARAEVTFREARK